MLSSEEQLDIVDVDPIDPIKEEEIPPLPSVEKIIEDMEARGDVIRFDLQKNLYKDRDGSWKELTPEMFWTLFRHTHEILVPHQFEKWIIGQDEALEKFRLNLVEWPRKLKDLTVLAERGKPVSQILKERPGPFILLVGEPGTGKSLLIKAGAEILAGVYKQWGIELYDVVAVKNPYDSYAPLTRYVKAGEGRKVCEAARNIITPTEIRDAVLNRFLWFLVLFGGSMVGTAILLLTMGFVLFDPAEAWFALVPSIGQVWLLVGVILMIFPLFIIMFQRMGVINLFVGKETEPNLLVDNSDGRLWTDATVTNASLLFGDVEWDPLGRSKAPHLRIKAGDTHKSHRKLLYIDEVRNLLFQPKIVAELLQIMEDGSSHIAGHEGFGGSSSTASQTVKTKNKVDCQFFLVAAGNLDVMALLESNEQGRALRDRFEGYGDIIYMKDEMEATPLNEMKIAQVVADEIYRFNFNPATADAVREVVSLMRRWASNNKHFKIRFRRVIGIIRRAAQLSWDANDSYIREEHVRQAYWMTRPLEEQYLLDHMKKTEGLHLLTAKGSAVGVINGLYVSGSGEGHLVGGANQISVWMKKVDDPERADYDIALDVKEGSWIEVSKKTVRAAIYRLYGIDLAKDYYVHVSFPQQKDVDGPSAGAAMTLAIMSILGDPDLPPEQRKPVPLRQDIGVTGTIENLGVGEKGDIKVGPVGGVYEKALGAKRFGLKSVICPKENYEHTLDKSIQRDIRVAPCSTIREYFSILTAEDGVK